MQNRFSPKRFGLMLAASLLLGSTGALAGSYEDSLDSARLGRVSQLSMLLDRGIDPDTVDAFNNSLLIIAARENHPDVVELLVTRGARISYRNEAGDSALMLASLRGNQAIAERLLYAGAEVNHEGWTPLMYAAFEGHAELVDLLIRAGADVNAKAPNNATAMMFAARNGHMEVVRRMLETDVDLKRESDRGYTAVTWAEENGHTVIAGMVREAIAARAARP